MTAGKHFEGSGALQVGDLRLVEDSSERSGTVVFDVVVLETVSEGQGGHSGKVNVSTGADRKENTLLGSRLRGVL